MYSTTDNKLRIRQCCKISAHSSWLGEFIIARNLSNNIDMHTHASSTFHNSVTLTLGIVRKKRVQQLKNT